MIGRCSLAILLGLIALGATGCSSARSTAITADARGGGTVLGAGDSLGWSVQSNHAAARRIQHAEAGSAASIDH